MNETDDLFGDIRGQFSGGPCEQRFGDCRRTREHSSVVEGEAEELRSIHIEARVARSRSRKCRSRAAAPKIHSLAKWLQLTKDVFTLAEALIVRKTLPPNAGNDALHIALGAVYALQFLLTWNFTHINNPATEEQVRSICREHDFHCPVICSPGQMLSL